jgi:two-component system, cell cycle sensor histidine kinase and response regulator CckA
MLVEDETDLRKSLADVLRSWTHAVLEAEDGADALRIARRFDGTIDLLITDVIMPNVSGRDLAVRLRDSRPSLRIIYMSGYSDQEFDSTQPFSTESTFLQKPFPFSRFSSSISSLFPDKISLK